MTADTLKKLEALAESDPELEQKLLALAEGPLVPIVPLKIEEPPKAEKKKGEMPRVVKEIIEFNKKQFAR